MRYLADTTFIIDLVNEDEGATNLAYELDEVGETVGLSVISAEEYLRGVYYLYWGSKKLKQKIAEAINDLNAFEILPITCEIARKAAELEIVMMKRGKPLALADILIASTALVHKLILITRNIKHFQEVPGLKIRIY